MFWRRIYKKKCETQLKEANIIKLKNMGLLHKTTNMLRARQTKYSEYMQI